MAGPAPMVRQRPHPPASLAALFCWLLWGGGKGGVSGVIRFQVGKEEWQRGAGEDVDGGSVRVGLRVGYPGVVVMPPAR